MGVTRHIPYGISIFYGFETHWHVAHISCVHVHLSGIIMTHYFNSLKYFTLHYCVWPFNIGLIQRSSSPLQIYGVDPLRSFRLRPFSCFWHQTSLKSWSLKGFWVNSSAPSPDLMVVRDFPSFLIDPTMQNKLVKFADFQRNSWLTALKHCQIWRSWRILLLPNRS